MHRIVLLALSAAAAGCHLMWPFAATGITDSAPQADAAKPADGRAPWDAMVLPSDLLATREAVAPPSDGARLDGASADSLAPDAAPADSSSDGAAGVCGSLAAPGTSAYSGAAIARHQIAGVDAHGLLLLHLVLEGTVGLAATVLFDGQLMTMQNTQYDADADLTLTVFAYAGTASAATIDITLTSDMAVRAAWSSWADAKIAPQGTKTSVGATGAPSISGQVGSSCRVVDFVATRSTGPLVPGPGQTVVVSPMMMGQIQVAASTRSLQSPASAWTMTWSTGAAPWIASATALEAVVFP